MSTSDRVRVTPDGIQFFEPDMVHKATLRNFGAVDADTYLDLPTTSGTLATQEYVAENGGGEGTSPLRVVVLDTVVDITNNDVMTNVFSIPVEANSKYYIEGFIPSLDAVDVDLQLVSPDGSDGKHFNYVFMTPVGNFGSKWNGDRLTGTTFGTSGVHIKFSGILITTGYDGDFKLRACQTVADPTTTEIPVGTFITITKAQ